MKVDKNEIVQKYVGQVFEQQDRNLDPKLLSKNRVGRSLEPHVKNIWRTGDFVGEEESDEEGNKRSKSIQVIMRQLGQ